MKPDFFLLLANRKHKRWIEKLLLKNQYSLPLETITSPEQKIHYQNLVPISDSIDESRNPLLHIAQKQIIILDQRRTETLASVCRSNYYLVLNHPLNKTTVLAAMLDFIRDYKDPFSSMLVIRQYNPRSKDLSHIRAVIPSEDVLIKQLMPYITKWIQHLPIDHKIFSVCINEALVNAYKHGNRKNANKNVTLILTTQKTRVIAKIKDEGPGFDRTTIADPLASGKVIKSSGRGIWLMTNNIDYVLFNDEGNEITLIKNFSE